MNKFIFEVEAPNIPMIPEKDILGVTVILVTVSYREKEFIRVGYYVNNEYTEEYDPEIGPPKPLDMDKVIRTILAEKPRVTKFPIPWGSNTMDDTTMINNNNKDDDVGRNMEMTSEMMHDREEGRTTHGSSTEESHMGNVSAVENGMIG